MGKTRKTGRISKTWGRQERLGESQSIGPSLNFQALCASFYALCTSLQLTEYLQVHFFYARDVQVWIFKHTCSLSLRTSNHPFSMKLALLGCQPLFVPGRLWQQETQSICPSNAYLKPLRSSHPRSWILPLILRMWSPLERCATWNVCIFAV